MKCPVCNDVRMREVEKDNVLIDVCPECKGVWLDRGELEKLLTEIREIRPVFNEWYDHRSGGHPEDRREADYNSQSNRNQRADYPTQQNYDPRYQKQEYDKGSHKYKKKKSVLDVFGDLFD